MTEPSLCRRAGRQPLIVGAALACGVAGAPAAHAAAFTAVTHTEQAGTRLPALGDSEVRVVVDGERGRLEYVRGGFGMPKDRVLVTSDGGRSATFYDPEEQVCGDAPIAGLSATGFRAEAAGLHRYENVRVEKKLDAAGGKLHGVATRHLRYAISYDLSTGNAPGSLVHVTVDSELWVAPALQDPAYALWLRAAPHSGDAEVDRRIGADMKDAKGAALKRVERSALQRNGGPEQKLSATMEVTRLTLDKAAAGDLEPPFACRSRTPKQ